MVDLGIFTYFNFHIDPICAMINDIYENSGVIGFLTLLIVSI